MAIGTGAAILGGSLISGAMGSSAARSAARSQSRSADAATAEQRRQYDLSRQDLSPWRNVGTQALNQMASLYGFQPQAAPSAPPPGGNWMTGGGASTGGIGGGLGGFLRRWGDNARIEADGGYSVADLGTGWASGGGPAAEPGSSPMGGGAAPSGMAAFFTSPDYTFRRDEGTRGLEQSAAARGGAFSGNALRGITDFSSNLAAGEYGNYWNRLAGLAGVGQTATSEGIRAGQNFANQYGANTMAAGDARASGIMGGANSWSNALNSGLNNYMLYRGGWFGGPGSSGGGAAPFSR